MDENNNNQLNDDYDIKINQLINESSLLKSYNIQANEQASEESSSTNSKTKDVDMMAELKSASLNLTREELNELNNKLEEHILGIELNNEDKNNESKPDLSSLNEAIKLETTISSPTSTSSSATPSISINQKSNDDDKYPRRQSKSLCKYFRFN